MSLDTDIRSPILVVADTHLGLLRKHSKYSRLVLGSLLDIESWSESTRLSEFLEWVRELPPKGAKPQHIPLGPWGKDSEELKLFRPGTLVLLGDFLELWDASDVAVEFASRAIWQTLGEIGDLGVKIVYVAGNHDFAIGKQLGQQDPPPPKGQKTPSSRIFPIGKSQVEIVEDIYPIMDEKTRDLPGTPVGKIRYIFLHGHQFDTLFRNTHGWTIMSYVRDGAEAFRLYSRVILLLAVVWSTYGLISLVSDRTAFASNWFFWAPLILLSILGACPRFVLSIGRPIFNKTQTSRYNPRKTLAGFPDWSKERFPAWWESQPAPNEKIVLVYGHTHLADIFTKNEINKFPRQERLRREKQPVLGWFRKLWRIVGERLVGKDGTPKIECDISLFNVPSWVGDRSENHESVLIDAALYIDEQGPKFLGWRWPSAATPEGQFYIPDEIVRLRADGEPLEDATLDKLRGEDRISPWTTINELRNMGWPDGILTKWAKGYQKELLVGWAKENRRVFNVTAS